MSCIGFISTRFAGNDGVSLETRKWVKVLNDLGHECCFFAGESDWLEAQSYVLAEAHFDQPQVRSLTAELFDDYRRQPNTSVEVKQLQDYIKGHLQRFLKQYEPQVLIVENALALPMHIPLGLAITELVAETAIPVIAHHHDFTWERERFAVGAASDYLRAAFPPTLPSIHHVVINSNAQHQLSLNAGVSSTIIPNVMDFDHPPPPPDGYADDLRSELGILPDEYLLLQPTRIVPRKHIEQSVELARRLELKCVLLVSHAAGDEGHQYQEYLQSYANLMGVRVLFAAHRFRLQRSQVNGAKIYSLSDAYQQSALVTYPSLIEGFGNAFLEAVYYQRPLFINSYVIFKTDIQPKGFRFITFDDYVNQGCVEQARHILQNPKLADEMVSHNYELGRRYFSYKILENHLRTLLLEIQGLSA
jgi:glycosyltransferase involved in cell wall biosynthesis